MTQQTRPKSAREIAQQIADDLFVNGQGEQADRLVLTVDSTRSPPQRERNLGGLAKLVVIDRIEKHLRQFQAWRSVGAGRAAPG